MGTERRKQPTTTGGGSVRTDEVVDGAPPSGPVPLPTGAVRRVVMDPSYDDEVFEIAAAKRDAEISHLGLGNNTIKESDPRRQHLESFFGDPSHRKGTRSYPVNGPSGGPRQRPLPTGNLNTAPSPGVLVLGPGGGPALLPAHAQAQRDLETAYTRVTTENPATSVLVGPLRTDALASLDRLAAAHQRKVARGLPAPTDELEGGLRKIVTSFGAEADRVLRQQRWEDLVRARMEFLATRSEKVLAEQAMQRAGDDMVLAGEIYDGLYAPLGFAPDAIGRITSGGHERALVDLRKVIPAPVWAGFLAGVTKSDPVLAFAVANGASVATDADPSSVLRVWRLLTGTLASVATARAVLALPTLVGGDVDRALKVARVLGTTAVPDLVKLTQIDGGGVIDTAAKLARLAGLGGDPETNHRILALTDPVSDKDLTAFNSRLGTSCTDAEARWTTLTTAVADEKTRSQVIRSFAKAPEAGLTDWTLLLDNWDDFLDRTSVDSAQVARLLTCGVFRASRNIYFSPNWGNGCVYTFSFVGGGRIEPEWHIHFQGRGTVVGAGWKNKAQKGDPGVKTYDQAPSLQTALKAVDVWRVVSI